MKYRNLGKSGLKVSPLVLGAMKFGGQTSAAESHRIIADAKDRGINFIDTADIYNNGESESVVGRAIASNRDDWILATKLGNVFGEGVNQRGIALHPGIMILDIPL